MKFSTLMGAAWLIFAIVEMFSDVDTLFWATGIICSQVWAEKVK